MKLKTSPLATTKSFENYIEVFKAGTHEDSRGKTATWSIQHLDEMVANHKKHGSAPLVIGHPKTNDPAYGWVKSLKRINDVLLAKFHKINPEFKAAVEGGSYLNRSIRIIKQADGFRLGHVGWLGAMLPAVGGLKPIELNLDKNTESFEFSTTPETKDSIVTPEEHKAAVKTAEANATKKAEADFSVKEAGYKKQLDEQRTQAQRIDYQAIVTAHIKRGVAPASLEGAADFMTTLDDETEFEFSQGDGDKAKKVKVNQVDFVKQLMDALPVSVSTKENDFSNDPTVNTDDADDIVKQATEFQLSEKNAGRDISVAAAVAHVTKGS